MSIFILTVSYYIQNDVASQHLSWDVKLKTRQVYNLIQEPVEQPPLGCSIAEEKSDNFKNQTGLNVERQTLNDESFQKTWSKRRKKPGYRAI